MKQISPRLTVQDTHHIGGIEHKHVVVDENGKRWLMKLQNGIHEYAAQAFVRAVGLRPIEVVQYAGEPLCDTCSEIIKGGVWEHCLPVLIEWIDDAFTKHDWKHNKRIEPPTPIETEVFSMSLLDFVIVNGDRHDGNYMTTRDGHVVPIDHGFCFSDYGYNYASIRLPDAVTNFNSLLSIATETQKSILSTIEELSGDPDLKPFIALVKRNARSLVAEVKRQVAKRKEDAKREKKYQQEQAAEKKRLAALIKKEGELCNNWRCWDVGRPHGIKHAQCFANPKRQEVEFKKIDEWWERVKN